MAEMVVPHRQVVQVARVVAMPEVQVRHSLAVLVRAARLLKVVPTVRV
jgi:hypothetical protein